MDIDGFELDDAELEAAQANREKRLQEDEVPVDLEGADDCGDSCTI